MLYLFAFIVPMAVWFISTLGSQIYPLGRNTIFTMDMLCQYTGFFGFLQDVLSKGESVFFSFTKGIGEETFGMIAYYLMSPFNLVIKFFSPENISEAVWLINMLKIGACGLTFAIFLRYKFKNEKQNKFAMIAFSCCYALMAYNIAYQLNIMWLDGVVWLPLVILGVDRLLDSNKPLLFYLSLSVSIISNWYIGFMLCVFSGLYVFYCFSLSEEDTKMKKLLRFILFGALSALTGAVVIVPSAFTLIGEYSRADLLSKVSITNFRLLDVLSKFVVGGFDFYQIADEKLSNTFMNLPNLYAGVGILLLFCTYFINPSFEKKEKVREICFLGLLIFSCFVGYINLFWHDFTFNVWYPYRYSFVISFFMIFIAYKGFLKISALDMKRIWLVFGILTLGYMIVDKLNYTFILPELILLTIFMLFACVLSLKMIRNEGKPIHYMFFLVVICVEMFANSFVYMKNFSYANRNEYYSIRDEVKTIVSEIKDKDKLFYRIEDDIVWETNLAMELGYFGISHSGTMANNRFRKFMGELGYTNIYLNITDFLPNTKFADSFLGVKYYVSDEKLYDETFETSTNRNVSLNKDALPIGFIVNSDILEKTNDINPFENQNEIAKATTGIDKNIYCKINLSDVRLTNLITDDKGKYVKRYKNSPAYYEFDFTAINEENVYLFMRGDTVDEAILTVNDKEIATYLNGDNYGVISLGKFSTDEKVNIKLEIVSDTGFEILTKLVYWENETVCKEILNDLNKEKLDIKEMTSSKINGSISVEDDDSILLLTTNYDKNLNVYIDGKKAETFKVFNTLLGVRADKGIHEVIVEYSPRDFKIGLYITLMSFIASTLVIIFIKKRQ